MHRDTRLEQACGFPGQRPFDRAQCGGWAHFPSVQKDCKERADTHKLAFRVAKTVVACASLTKQAARWAAEAHVLLRFRTRNDTRTAAPRARTRPPRGSSASARRARRRLQDRCATGFLPSFPYAFRKTVISTRARSEGTACSWDEFSILGVGRWTVPSSSAPNVERCTGNVRTRCAAAAANFLAVEHRSCAN